MAVAVIGGLVASLALASCAADSGEGQENESPGSIVVASSGTIGIPALVAVTALERLEEKYGYETEMIETADTAVLIEGVSNGTFDVGGGAATAAMKAIQAGGNLKIVGTDSQVTHILVSNLGIDHCDDIAGLRMGLHSAGSATVSYYNHWVSQECTKGLDALNDQNIIFIGGSENRAAALTAGQLDVAVVSTPDLLALDDSYEIIVEFGDYLEGKVLPNPVYMNTTFLEENPELAQRYMEESVRAARDFLSDREFYLSIIKKYLTAGLSDEDANALSELAGSFYLEDGGLSSLERFDEILDFMTNVTGEIEGDVTVDMFIDKSLLEAAVAAVD